MDAYPVGVYHMLAYWMHRMSVPPCSGTLECHFTGGELTGIRPTYYVDSSTPDLDYPMMADHPLNAHQSEVLSRLFRLMPDFQRRRMNGKVEIDFVHGQPIEVMTIIEHQQVTKEQRAWRTAPPKK